MAVSGALKYASVTMVKARLNSRTPLTDQQIENFIEQSEQYVDAVMKNAASGGFVFDASKHQIVRDAVVNRAALYIMCAEPLYLTSLEQAATQMDVVRDALMGDLDLLSKNDYVLYLRGL